MNLKKHFIVSLFFFLIAELIFSQNLSVISKNFNSADYSENAEFRCAVDDGKGTTYFGTNYGILVYRGEKRNISKNWDYILLPEPDITNALYLDKKLNRLYVGAKNVFGYFQILPFGNSRFIDLTPQLPAIYNDQSEIWHINKVGDQIIFHSIAALFIFKNEKINVIPAPQDFIFHNVFALKSDLLINSLNNSWYLYNKSLIKINSELPCNDKCYAVLPTNRKGNYFFIYRNIGIYSATYSNGTISHVVKVSDPAMDHFLSEQQVYCAEKTVDEKYVIIGTLNSGALIFKNIGQFNYNESLIGELQKQTDVASVYGLYKNELGDVWILGKTNLSVLPANLNFYYNDFVGATIYSLIRFKNELFIASSKGIYKIVDPNNLQSQPQLLSDKVCKKLVQIRDTIYGFDRNNLIVYDGKKFSNYSFDDEIVGLENFNNEILLGTSTKLYNGIGNIKNNVENFNSGGFEPFIALCTVKDKIYLATLSETPIIALNANWQVINEYGYNSVFNSVNNIRLFNCNDQFVFTNLKNTFCIVNNEISNFDNDGGKIWYYEKNVSEEIMLEIDSNNINVLQIKPKNANDFIQANLFYANTEVNDIERVEANYFIGDKNALFISELYKNVKPHDLFIYSFQSNKKDFNIDSAIVMPYEANNELRISCGINSFYASFPNTEYFYCLNASNGGVWKSQFVSEIFLNNLSWGDYELQIRANYSNSLSTPIKTIKFIIQKPWYITWWALVSWIILFVLFIYTIVQISIYRLKKSKIRLERIVKQRTHEIEEKKNEIEKQKEEIQHKNKEITDSINYAKRIQTALLKEEGSVQSILPDSFVLYIPKDIVSGDFYWFHEFEDVVIVAIADCTGHGVPGAFMSMLGVAKLNELAAKNYTRPDIILKELNKLIVETLDQNKAGIDSRDGMDIGIIAINKSEGKYYYAGAYRPLYIVDNTNKSIQEIKPTKLPVGGSQYGYDRTYELHEFDIRKDLTLYLTTDGYADQFGGLKGKKFMVKNLINLFIENGGFSSDKQRQLFEKKYLKWKADYEQVDDVCVFGIKF